MSHDPANMTVAQFVVWRIRRQMSAGQTGVQIARSLGLSRMTVWRVMKCNNLLHRDNRHDSGIEKQLGETDTGQQFLQDRAES